MMKNLITLILILETISFSNHLYSQSLPSKEDSLLRTHGEIYFKFNLQNEIDIDSLTRIISIDNYKDGEGFAYANRDEFINFLKLGINYEVLLNPCYSLKEEDMNMGKIQKSASNMTIWNFYPTYSQYVNFMNTWATTYPSICKLDTIGTSVQGRLLLALKISDSVNYDRGVPQVFLTSSIHGDEITGYVLMMHLIDSLLNSYGTSTRITNMLKNTQIFINPLANPDGTYYGGDNTVGSARRANQFGVDMNRNYPDPQDGQHPDGKIWQPETVDMMKYAAKRHFSLAMNFHGGAEVVNYPWDTWCSPTLTSDDTWWQYVSKQYADTAHFYGSTGYFTNPYGSGYTNGCAWYTISGGRQDYHNYFRHVREVTLEISVTKNPAGSTMLNFWKYNYRCFFNYIEQSKYGINGKIYDSITGAPIAAKVFINGFDTDSSFVYSTLPSGWYFRMLDNGTRSITFSAPGYYSRTITNVTSTRGATTRLNVKLRPVSSDWPRSFLASAVSGSEIDLTWLKNGSNNPVMIAYNTSATFGTPVNGTSYSQGSAITGGGTVLYVGPNTSLAHIELNPNTQYYYRAWSVLAGNSYSSPASSNATTFCGIYNTFPITENFNTATVQLPDCWSQEATGNSAAYTNPWMGSNTNVAGGTAYEVRLGANAVNPGNMRLKTFKFNTVGVTTLTLSFRYRVSSTGTGATLRVQSSSDGVNWTNESWSYATANSNPAATTVTINITNNLNSPTTMLAFYATGTLSRITYWAIDDISIKAPGYWVGGTPGNLTDWNTGTNWGDGLVPTAATNVYIPKRTYLPLVTNDQATPAQCNNMVVSGSSTISVSAGKSLKINGNLSLQAP